MKLQEIIAELEGAAQQEAAGIHILETTRFEPELDAVSGSCILAARRRAEALTQAARRLRVLMQGDFASADPRRPNRTVAA